MKKVSIVLSGIIFCAVIIIASCKKEGNDNLAKTPSPQLRSLTPDNTTCGTPQVVNFIAGQNMVAGTITVSNTATAVTVTYTTTNGWYMNEVHLYVGDLAQAPTNGPGNPVPGQFPYTATFSTPVQSYTFTIPLSALNNCFIVAAHAAVTSPSGGNETAWGAGTRFTNKGNWATYFTACKQSCYEGCVIAPTQLFQGEPNWPNGPSVTIGGYTYTPSVANLIYNSAGSDSKEAFILIASIKISGSVSASAPILGDAAIVENWLSTLGQLTGSSQFTAPANVETAIANVQAWEKSHICP